MKTLAEMQARKAEISKQLSEILEKSKTEKRELTTEETAETDALLQESDELDTAITEERSRLDRLERAGRVAGQYSAPITTEEREEPYRKGGTESYFRDLFNATAKQDRNAIERLIRNNKHFVDKGKDSKVPQVRAMSTTAGAGGEFAPPMWQVENFVAYLRPGRPTADLFNHEDLPAGVSSINLPKVTLGALTGAQSSQNTAVANRDFQTGSVSTGINTVAGQVVVSQQDIDQTPINLDQVILNDLTNDYGMQIDIASLTALAAVSGLNAVTYTDASPTSLKVLANVQAGVDQVHQGVFRPATAVIMRPDRWGHFVAAGDSTGRPFVLPNAQYGPWNARGIGDGPVPQGQSGTIAGVPAILDPNIPNNLGTGTNQDEIFVLRPEEIWLYESTPKAEVFQQTYANQLSVLCRFYAYYGLIANRLPKAISVVSGTGMIQPAYGS